MPHLPARVRSPYRPAEPVMFSTPLGLDTLGAQFSIDAPFSACRLCGALYQSEADRLARHYLETGRIVEHFNSLSRESYFTGDSHAISILDISTERRDRWRKLHERRYHTQQEIDDFGKTCFAFTPEAANRLAPFGITPLGNMHEEIVDALFTAPRAPLNDAEGS